MSPGRSQSAGTARRKVARRKKRSSRNSPLECWSTPVSRRLREDLDQYRVEPRHAVVRGAHEEASPADAGACRRSRLGQGPPRACSKRPGWSLCVPVTRPSRAQSASSIRCSGKVKAIQLIAARRPQRSPAPTHPVGPSSKTLTSVRATRSASSSTRRLAGSTKI